MMTGKVPLSPQDLRDFIQTNLPCVPVPAIPEVRLHQARPSSGLWRLAEQDENGFSSPYWAYPWPGGIALARHILDRPDIVAGRRALDLGAGSGLVAIAAAKAGASGVVAVDIDPYAAAALDLNGAANRVSITRLIKDLTGGPPPAVERVLVGDLFYAPTLAHRVTAFLDRCIDGGIEVLVGDIGRAFLPTSRLSSLADYPMPDFGQVRDPKLCTVFAFGKAPN